MLSDHNKDKLSSPQLSLLVNTTDPYKVLEEVKIIFQDMFNTDDFTLLSSVFEDVFSLFSGKYYGFKACDTPYHNLKHTTDVFLAMARLIHGAHTQGFTLNAIDANLGLVAALMHDTGYIQKDSENYGSGAELLPVHVQRSITFMQKHLSGVGSTADFISRCETVILCTDLDYPFNQHCFITDVDKRMGQMIAASDLLAQTADRIYIEKLPLLLQEFQKAGIKSHENELGLIKEAPQFNDFMRHRLVNELDGVDRYMRPHFKCRWGIDLNMYQVTIDRSLSHLSARLKTDNSNYRKYFRRIKGL